MASPNLKGGWYLNAFIVSVTFSKVAEGKEINIDSEGMRMKFSKGDKVAYYKDHVGVNHSIRRYDNFLFLMEKPDLVVSPEGILLFYTNDKIFATLDFDNIYYWVDGHAIDLMRKYIKKIEVCGDYSKVILGSKDDNEESSYSLKFDMNLSSSNKINCKVVKL